MGTPSKEKCYLKSLQYAPELLKQLNNLRQEQVFTDATLCVQHEEIYCHRIILAASSPYFRAMFSHNLREGRDYRVSFQEVSPWTMKRLIEYVYTGNLEITTENAQELLSAGSLFEFPAIVSACCDFLKQQLHVSNCLGIEEFAMIHSCKKLQDDAHKYALENFSSVVESDEFLHLSLNRLKEYIASDWIEVQVEDTVYEAVMRWVNYDIDERRRDLCELLEEVRLPVIDLNKLTIIEHNPLIRSMPNCLKLVMEAKEQHESIHDQHGRRRRSMQNSQVHPRPSTVATEKLVVIGGQGTKSMEMYDPQKDKWFDLPSFPKSVTSFSVCAVSNSIVVTGGILENRIISEVWKFDSVKRVWLEMPPLLKPRAQHSSGVLQEKLFVLGGITYETTSSCKDLDTIESYDSRIKAWTVVGHSLFPRSISRIVSHNDALVEVGGLQAGVKVKTIDSYMLSENGKMKSTGEQFILPDAIQFAQIVVINGIFYIIWEDSKKMIALNPQKRTFQTLADLHYSHKYSGATVLGDRIYLTGGLVDSRPSNIVECYDPNTNTWTIEKTMKECRAFHGCATIQL
ncbi:kelch-like protein 21 [Saccostrea echinata]|uniref:kelch-like protein 21 n=1 Tax=Saccostrea echinata TaxID=191078 RepID=UPI002A828744|nr:kelch-like protein 21 [Saccostrea echinata]